MSELLFVILINKNITFPSFLHRHLRKVVIDQNLQFTKPTVTTRKRVSMTIVLTTRGTDFFVVGKQCQQILSALLPFCKGILSLRARKNRIGLHMTVRHIVALDGLVGSHTISLNSNHDFAWEIHHLNFSQLFICLRSIKPCCAREASP